MYDTTTVIDYVRKALPDFFGSDAELKAGVGQYGCAGSGTATEI